MEQFRWQQEAKMLVRNEDILKATLRSRCVWYFGWNGKPDENLRLKPIFQLRSVSLVLSACIARFCEMYNRIPSFVATWTILISDAPRVLHEPGSVKVRDLLSVCIHLDFSAWFRLGTFSHSCAIRFIKQLQDPF